MSAHEIVLGIMAFFAVLGGLDRIFGSPFGLGEKFEEGILAMGSLAMAMLGIICLAPVLADLLRPVVVPVSLLVMEIKAWVLPLLILTVYIYVEPTARPCILGQEP